MANNLPKNLGRHKAFRYADYSHTYVFPDTYQLPAQEDITVLLRGRQKAIIAHSATITKAGQRLTIKYPQSDIARLSTINHQYILFNGRPVLGGELLPCATPGSSSTGETIIREENGDITSVEMTDLELVKEMFDKMPLG